ncbi:MAG: hypothetical protein AB8H80_08970 [Planctomycetota bacterium]
MAGIDSTPPIPSRHLVRERSTSGQPQDSKAFEEELNGQNTPKDDSPAGSGGSGSGSSSAKQELGPIAAAQERARQRAALRSKSASDSDPHGRHVDVVA